MHRVIGGCCVLLAALALGAVPTVAQDDDCRILCSPVFVAQPGLVVQNSLNRPTLDAQGNTPSSETDFLLRFTTVIPTEIPRTALVALVQWFPFNRSVDPETGRKYNFNAPAFVYGPVFSLFSLGPLSTSLDALGVYAKSGESGDYKHVFVMEGIATLALGEMMEDMTPYLRGVAFNVLYSQQISDRAPDFNGDRKFTPNLLFLVTLPVAPLPH